MIKDKRTIIYRSTYAEEMSDFFESQLSSLEYEMLCMLFYGFGVPQKLQSAYFQLFRVGDGKYTLTVQKYLDDTYCIKFSLNNNYANINERFAK